MMPAGRGWAKNSGLFDEEELAQIQGVDAEPLPPTGSVTTIRGPVGTQDTVLVRGLDVSAPAPRAPLRAPVQPAPEVAEAPPSKTAALTGLADEDLRAAMRSDSKRRLIDSIVNAGAMATAGLSNRDYTPIAGGKYNQEDKVRAQLASAADFDLRKSGAEAKAQHWQELAEARAGQLGLNADKLKAMIEAKDKEEAGKNERAKQQSDTQKEIADMKAQVAKLMAGDANATKLKVAAMKGKGKGAGVRDGSTSNALFGYDDKFDVEMEPGYPKLDATTARAIGKKITYNRDVKESLQRIKELTRRSLEHPLESVSDGTNAQLKSLVEFSIPTLATAQEQGVVNAGDAPRARATMAQYDGLTAQGVFDRLNALTGEDKSKLLAFEKGIDETIAAFQRGVDSTFKTKRLRLVPRKGSGAPMDAAKAPDASKPAAGETEEDRARKARIAELKKKLEKK